ncbi:MAG TPA: ABC transporter permease, partial [Vicinamibacterales bacterium]|nr:ABC transporter permease [Vicinamibacterales bacterium]
MSTFLQDLRHGARLLLHAPGFTLVAVAALAIGIGANTAMFSVVNALLLRPLPYPDPERLAVVWEHNLPRDKKDNVVSPGNFLHWREMQQAFTDLAAISGTAGLSFKVTVTGNGEPEEVPVQFVSAAFFPLLGVQPALGRPFSEGEDRPNSRVAVLSDRLWKRRYGGDRTILGRGITVQGVSYSVVGIMPPGFSFVDKTVELWLPIGFSAEARTPRGRWVSVVGRLKPGVTFEQAQQEMTRVHAELTRQFPSFNTGWTARVVALKEQLTGKVRPALLVLLAAVAVVLLIACANVANLLLARATARQRELAVRAALGAARARLVRQLLSESAVLAIVGGAAGLFLAWVGVRAMRLSVAEKLPIQRLESVGIDGWVLAFTLGASLLSGLVFGLIPALTTSGGALGEMLKEGGRTGTGHRGKRTRSGFVVVQIALALVLLTGAGLLIRSFVRLVNVHPGFNPQGTVTFNLSLPGSRYADPERRLQFYGRVLERISALPGVHAVGATSFLPLRGLGAATSFEIVGRPKPPAGEEPVADVRVIAGDYFRTMGIPLLRGRLFRAGDAADENNRVIINQTMAEKYWPGEDPIGKRVRISWNDIRDDEIIGVVADVKDAGLDATPRAMTYWPYARFTYPGMAIVVRTGVDPAAIVNSLASVIRSHDAELAMSGVKTMQEVVAESIGERRATMILLGIFAGAALVLAAVGIYGVVAYSVTQRTQEIGIRMALGAQQGDVLRMVVGQALVLAIAGVAVGCVGALVLTRSMA